MNFLSTVHPEHRHPQASGKGMAGRRISRLPSETSVQAGLLLPALQKSFLLRTVSLAGRFLAEFIPIFLSGLGMTVLSFFAYGYQLGSISPLEEDNSVSLSISNVFFNFFNKTMKTFWQPMIFFYVYI
ncbi:MAG: hypothetical protein ABII90_09670 [Bacteroidota bacterium]